MWYWIVMAVLVIGCIALLSGTFFSIKKNKAEEAAKRAEARKKKRKKPADAEEAQQPGEDGKEQMADRRAARVQRTGGSSMHRHAGKKHAGHRQSREKSRRNAASGK